MNYKLIFILLLQTAVLFAQEGAYITGGADDDIGYCFTFNEIGGYVLAGSERTHPDSSEQISISSISKSGDLIWKRVYGDKRHEFPHWIEVTSDNGYIVAGSKWDQGFWRMDAYVMKLNSEGIIQWTKHFGGDYTDEGFSVQELSNGHFLVAGFTKSDAPGSLGQMFIVRISAGGDTIWEKTIGGTDKDFAFHAIEDADKNIVVVGHKAGFHRYSSFEYTQTDSDILACKLDASGNILWQKEFGGAENDLGYQVLNAPQSGYYIIGSTQSSGSGSFDMYLLKIDSDGNEEWSKTFGGTSFDYGRSASISDDGYIYLSGTTNNDPASNKTDILVCKLDLDGNEIWSATYGGTESEYGYTIRATNDGGCVLIGSTRSDSKGGSDIIFMKLLADGTPENLSGSKESFIVVYPNPTADYLTIYYENDPDCFSFEYAISDANGKRIYHENKSSKIVKIDVSGFQSGAYFLMISSDCADTQMKKFIVR